MSVFVTHTYFEIFKYRKFSGPDNDGTNCVYIFIHINVYSRIDIIDIIIDNIFYIFRRRPNILC